MSSENINSDLIYPHYNDFTFRSILQRRANGLLKFIRIPFKIKRMISELTSIGPNTHRMDFAGEADVENNDVCVILECQSNLPTEDDIIRFFQYVSSLRVFKNCKVELFILCTEKAPYDKKEFVLKDDCVYTMHMISLKQFRARDIFKSIEYKLKNNEEINDEDIASLQIIVYTDFEESKLDIFLKARKLLEKIAAKSDIDINEKKAIIYLFNVLSANMLDDDEHGKYMEENVMLIDPVERYCVNKGREEGRDDANRKVAEKMLDSGYPINEIVKISSLSKEDILALAKNSSGLEY